MRGIAYLLAAYVAIGIGTYAIAQVPEDWAVSIALIYSIVAGSVITGSAWFIDRRRA